MAKEYFMIIQLNVPTYKLLEFSEVEIEKKDMLKRWMELERKKDERGVEGKSRRYEWRKF